MTATRAPETTARPSRRLVAWQNTLLFVNRRLAKNSDSGDVEAGRKSLTTAEKLMRLARGVTVSEEVIGGVPVRRYSSGSTKKGVLLHVHGGAYVGGSSLAARAYTRTVAETGHDMVSVDYRRPPEHPYPAAVDDSLAVYRALSSEPVIVMGESAGGGLTLALVQRIRDEKLPMPVGTVPVFPWADLTQSSETYELNGHHDILSKSGLDDAAAMYANGADLRTPGISPLFGSFAGFPKTLIPVGTHDSLLGDARAVTAAMKSDGVDVRLMEVPGAVHGFLLLPVPEVRRVIDAISAFARECFGD